MRNYTEYIVTQLSEKCNLVAPLGGVGILGAVAVVKKLKTEPVWAQFINSLVNLTESVQILALDYNYPLYLRLLFCSCTYLSTEKEFAYLQLILQFADPSFCLLSDIQNTARAQSY